MCRVCDYDHDEMMMKFVLTKYWIEVARRGPDPFCTSPAPCWTEGLSYVLIVNGISWDEEEDGSERRLMKKR